MSVPVSTTLPPNLPAAPAGKFGKSWFEAVCVLDLWRCSEDLLEFAADTAPTPEWGGYISWFIHHRDHARADAQRSRN